MGHQETDQRDSKVERQNPGQRVPMGIIIIVDHKEFEEREFNRLFPMYNMRTYFIGSDQHTGPGSKRSVTTTYMELVMMYIKTYKDLSKVFITYM